MNNTDRSAQRIILLFILVLLVPATLFAASPPADASEPRNVSAFSMGEATGDQPVVHGSLPMNLVVPAMLPYEGYLYISNCTTGLYTVRYNEDNGLELLDTISNPPDFIYQITASSQVLYALDGFHPIAYNLTDPAHPSPIPNDFQPLIGPPRYMKAVGSIVYMATTSIPDIDLYTFETVSFADPAAPQSLGYFYDDNACYSLQQSSIYPQYLVLFGRSTRVLDITDPAGPVEVFQFDFPLRYGRELADRFVAITSWPEGSLQLFELQEDGVLIPREPIGETGFRHIDTNGSLLAAAKESEMVLYHRSGGEITEWTRFPVTGTISGVALDSSCLYVSTYDSLFAYPLSGLGVETAGSTAPPEQFRIAGVYPNPFNSTARVVFDLPSPETVLIRVFDLLGRRVARLHSGNLGAGRHEVMWNAEGIGSGMYLVQVRAGARTDVRKVVLVK
ncbi:MAG TPA: T9SS type A sorting domain-containing protein [Bacteroidetes bacterium]|nr:T9SS type A sorting domain-containing protein [Bacteroidota bacterium]